MTLFAVLNDIQYVLVFAFGVIVPFSLAGVRSTRKNVLLVTGVFLFCGALHFAAYNLFATQTVWIIYPLIVHLPLVLAIRLIWKRRVLTGIAAVTATYLCANIPKWFGVLTLAITGENEIGMAVRILLLPILAFVCIRYIAPSLSRIYTHSISEALLFTLLPVTYYIFDCVTSTFPSLAIDFPQTVAQFFPFVLAITHFVFMFIYFKIQQAAQKSARNEQFFRYQLEQRSAEINMIRNAEQELRLMRHDMRLHLNNLAICLENGDMESAQKLISGLTQTIDRQKIERYCENTIINYILTDFKARFRERNISVQITVELPSVEIDEVGYSAILSNILENALYGQDDVPAEERYVKILLKYYNGKLLLSVRNPIDKKPVFADGLPINLKPGHGYGTQSIAYLSERMGGKYHFSANNGVFLARVII